MCYDGQNVFCVGKIEEPSIGDFFLRVGFDQTCHRVKLNYV